MYLLFLAESHHNISMYTRDGIIKEYDYRNIRNHVNNDLSTIRLFDYYAEFGH